MDAAVTVERAHLVVVVRDLGRSDSKRTLMVTFLALYRGASVAEAEVVGLSADPELVADFAARLLLGPVSPDQDPVLDAKHRSQRETLRLLIAESSHRNRDDG